MSVFWQTSPIKPEYISLLPELSYWAGAFIALAVIVAFWHLYLEGHGKYFDGTYVLNNS